MPDEERLRVANCFLRDLMRQYSVDGFFHADPHPGNLFVFEDGRIGYIDFGIMGRAVTGPIHMLKFFKGTVEPDIRYATEGLVRFAQTRIEEEARELFLQEPKYRQASDIVINFIIEKLSEDLEPTNGEWHKQTGNRNCRFSSAVPQPRFQNDKVSRTIWNFVSARCNRIHKSPPNNRYGVFKSHPKIQYGRGGERIL